MRAFTKSRQQSALRTSTLARRCSAFALAISLTLAGIARAADDTRVGADAVNGIDASGPHGGGSNGQSGGGATASSSVANTSNTATATGGNGGKGGDGGLGDPPGPGGNPGHAGSGGIGGNANAHAGISTSDPSIAQMIAGALSIGGAGGQVGASAGTVSTSGAAGVGGNAISSMLGLSTSDTQLFMNAQAYGGVGGSGGFSNYFGNGGAGGTPRVSSNPTSPGSFTGVFNINRITG